jgi:hypothetical protein
MPYSCYYNKKMLGASWFLHVSLFAERSYRSCGEKFITLPPFVSSGATSSGASAQIEHKGGSGCSLSSKMSPFFLAFIIPLPVYSHTAFLDDFFLRSFPYTQAEATPLWRTRGEISPLSKATARVCAEISTCFIRRVPDPRRVLKGALRAVTA